MPPVFSFRIDRPYDLAALIGYGFTSLAAIHLFRRGARQEIPSDNPTFSGAPTGAPEFPIVRPILPEWRSPLAEEEFELHFDPKVSKVIADVLDLVKQGAGVAAGTSLHSARRPGIRKIWIVAHRAGDQTLTRSLIIGRRDEDCQKINRPDWPGNCSVTWFDNAAERVYQITVER